MKSCGEEKRFLQKINGKTGVKVSSALKGMSGGVLVKGKIEQNTQQETSEKKERK